jgi:hypothetical protein
VKWQDPPTNQRFNALPFRAFRLSFLRLIFQVKIGLENLNNYSRILTEPPSLLGLSPGKSKENTHTRLIHE